MAAWAWFSGATSSIGMPLASTRRSVVSRVLKSCFCSSVIPVSSVIESIVMVCVADGGVVSTVTRWLALWPTLSFTSISRACTS